MIVFYLKNHSFKRDTQRGEGSLISLLVLKDILSSRVVTPLHFVIQEGEVIKKVKMIILKERNSESRNDARRHHFEKIDTSGYHLGETGTPRYYLLGETERRFFGA